MNLRSATLLLIVSGLPMVALVGKHISAEQLPWADEPSEIRAQLMVRFTQQKASLARAYWRRGVFLVDGQTVSVTGKLSQITFSEQTIQGELKTKN